MILTTRMLVLNLSGIISILAAVDALPSLHAQTQVEAKGGVAIGGNATNVNIGILPKQLPAIIEAANRPLKEQTSVQRQQIRQLERSLGATRSELTIIFRAFGVEDVPEEQRSIRLIEIAAKFRELKQDVNALPRLDPLQAPAKATLESGDFAQTAEIVAAAEFVHQLGRQAKITANSSGVRFSEGWDVVNITTVEVPQLRGVSAFGQPGSGKFRFYSLAHKPLRAAFIELESRGLLSEIKDWCGAFTTTYPRNWPDGIVSPHMLGLAFDVNCHVSESQKTTVNMRAVAEVMSRHGFIWGGSWGVRPEPGHFQFVGLPDLAGVQ